MRILLIHLVVVACCLTASCRKENPPIERTKMQAIILDVQTAEIYSTMAGKDSLKDYVTKNEDSLAVYYNSIFRHHGVTADQFKKAIDWYKVHPSDLDSIYLKLLPDVEKNRAERGPY